MVTIKKLRSNYEVRNSFNQNLIDFLKSIPKEQCQAKVNPLVMPDGSVKQDWFRLCNEAGLSKILTWCKETGTKFSFDNISEEESKSIISKLSENFKKKVEAIKLKNEGIDVDGEDYSFMKIDPFIYQKQAVKFFETCSGNAILGDQPGSGKSLMAIAYAVKNRYKTLVIVPASLKLNWRNEIAKFTVEKCFIFKFKPKKKDNITVFSKEESLFHVINYESLESYFDFNYSHKCSNYNCKWEAITTIKKYPKCPNCGRAKTIKSRAHHLITKTDKDGDTLDAGYYDLIVIDEAHYIKNPTAFRTQIIRKAFKESSKKLLMTGTAIKNRPYEFFPLLNLVDPKEWSNAHAFGVRYCNAHQDKFGHWDYNGSSRLEELYERISPFFLRRLKKDILKFLPPKTFTVIPIELTPEKAREYHKIENGIVDESQETDDKVTHLARIQKLKQFTSNYNAKQSIEFIQNIIDGDEKIVVFSQFISTTKFVHEYFEEKSVWFTGQHNMVEKQQAVDRFMNDESCKVFVGTIGAAGVGITLTSASVVLFIDLPWTPSDFEQCSDRVHRASQTSDNVQIIKLICQNTIDVDIDRLLTEKGEILSQVLDGELFEDNKQLSIFDDLVKTILAKKNM